MTTINPNIPIGEDSSKRNNEIVTLLETYDKTKSINAGAIVTLNLEEGNIISTQINALAKHFGIDLDMPISKIPKDILYSKSMINTVPSKLNMFFTLPNFDDVMKNTYQLILAGEALNENLVRDIRKKYNPIIYNGYGPCETTIFASIKEISSTNKVTIGKPNLNTHIYILNNDKQLCPIGIPGELCIGGKQVSAGYLDKNETKHHFINNLFGNDIIYCTGDLAYLDFDGELNFIGRKDSQIKINGQRIELEEVNKAIENYTRCL